MVERNLQTVSTAEVGPEAMGNLSIFMAWRRPARGDPHISREWCTTELLLGLEELAVDPSAVLYWDSQPEKLNSDRRFRMMLAHRAQPRILAGGNEGRHVGDLIGFNVQLYAPRYVQESLYVARAYIRRYLATPYAGSTIWRRT